MAISIPMTKPKICPLHKGDKPSDGYCVESACAWWLDWAKPVASARTEGRTMYEELVKRLRESKNNQCYIGCFGLCGDCRIDAELKQAADAIEELSKLVDAIPHICECCIGSEVESGGCDRGFVLSPKRAGEYLSKFRWNPVAERLPSAYKEVLLRFPHNQAAGFYDRDGCWAVYSGDGFYTEVADNEPKPTHWMKKLPEPPKEEGDKNA